MGSGMDLGSIEYGRLDLDLGSSRNRVDRVGIG